MIVIEAETSCPISMDLCARHLLILYNSGETNEKLPEYFVSENKKKQKIHGKHLKYHMMQKIYYEIYKRPAPLRWPLIAVTAQMRFSMQNAIVNEIEKREEITRRER